MLCGFITESYKLYTLPYHIIFSIFKGGSSFKSKWSIELLSKNDYIYLFLSITPLSIIFSLFVDMSLSIDMLSNSLLNS